MEDSKYFFLVFVLVLVLTRVGVYLWVYYVMNYLHQAPPQTIMFGFRVHHYMYGILLMIIGAISKNMMISAVGMALFVDELPFVLRGVETHEANYSLLSNLGVVFFAFVVYFFRENLLKIFS
ncbi:hypothetical protein JKY72_01245 [Candidatus Gracilibacteria bacterium]|nr:hypothetical protein [Candidatus Gracilibacteria bacterium]